MRKLGIAFKTTSLGAGAPIVVNDGPWKSRVVDIRDFLKHCPALASDYSKFVVFLLFGNDGAYVVTARTISGRSMDNTAGWIFIPWNMEISGNQVYEVIKGIQQLLIQPQLPDSASLNRIFSADYPDKKVADTVPASVTQGPFAVRKCNAENIDLLLGSARCQQYYSKFVAVFMADNPNDFTDVTDLSAQPLILKTTLMPPTIKELVDIFGPHVALYYMDEKQSLVEFNSPILATINSNVKFRIARNGFEPIDFSMNVIPGLTSLPLNQVKFCGWDKKLSLKDFKISTEGSQGKSPAITVNGKSLSMGPVTVHESELANVQVSVTCPGYEKVEKTIDFRSQNLPVRIPMRRAESTFERKIELANGSEAQITITGRDIPRNQCPLEGYEVSHGRLQYVPEPRWIDWLIGAGAGILLCVTAFFIWQWLSDDEVAPQGTEDEQILDRRAQEEEKAKLEEEEKAKLEEEEEARLLEEEQKALEYLDSHDIWERGEMEQITRLKDLWDAINNLNIPALKNFDALRVKSDKLKKIIKVIVENPGKKVPYCRDNDTQITLSKFESYLTGEHQRDQNTVNPGQDGGGYVSQLGDNDTGNGLSSTQKRVE